MANTSLELRWPRLGQAFDELFEPWNGLLSDGMLSRTLTTPRVNVTEDKNGYMLSLAAPGLTKKDFKIDVSGNMLTISAKKEESKEEKEGTYSRKEYNYSSFSRTFTLPDEVEKDKLDAKYEDGVLKLMLPKNEKAMKLHKEVVVK